MDNQHLKDLMHKAEAGDFTPEEKMELIRELNARLEEYNKALKEALVAVPKET